MRTQPFDPDVSVGTQDRPGAYFLPYQLAWINDRARFKIVKKSRRVGYTYAESYENVEAAVSLKGFPPNGRPYTYFSSADESAALEYIEYCEQWTRMFDMAAKILGEVVIDKKDDIKAFVIEYANGAKIHALRSNPKAFRSKGGKVVLDEFAFHDNPDLLWRAARPCITWGYPIHILSTLNGKSNRYYRTTQDAENKPDSIWSLHETTIIDAVEQGLAAKILGLDRPATKAEREKFIADEREACGDDSTWMQEYMCEPMDETTAFLTYDLIEAIEDEMATVDGDLSLTTGDLYLGMDIGRRKHLSVIWVDELLGDVRWTRKVIVMEKRPFRFQREMLFDLLGHPKIRRACIDSTGLGMQLAEEAQETFGTYRVEAVNFTQASKEEMAFHLLASVEDRQHRIPSQREIRDDLHSVRKVVTRAGNIRFDAASSEQGHADRFWAKALANHAAATPTGPVEYRSVKKRRMGRLAGAY